MKCYRKCIFLCVLILDFQVIIHANHGPRDPPFSSEQWPDENVIINGETTKHAVPYMASLQTKSGHHRCGGGILSTHHVISAAHCVEKVYPGDIFVVVGSIEKTKGKSHGVTHIFVHPEYCSMTLLNDIALLKVAPSFNFAQPTVQPIRLRRTYLDDDMPVLVSGWGMTSFEPRRVPNILQLSYETTINIYKCVEVYNNSTITSSQLCTFNASRTCKGDSGSPVVTLNTKEPEIVGIVSFGLKNCAYGPRIRTRLSSFLDFIDSVMNISY